MLTRGRVVERRVVEVHRRLSPKFELFPPTLLISKTFLPSGATRVGDVPSRWAR